MVQSNKLYLGNCNLAQISVTKIDDCSLENLLQQSSALIAEHKQLTFQIEAP